MSIRNIMFRFADATYETYRRRKLTLVVIYSWNLVNPCFADE